MWLGFKPYAWWIVKLTGCYIKRLLYSVVKMKALEPDSQTEGAKAWAVSRAGAWGRKFLLSLLFLLRGSKYSPVVRGLECHKESNCQGPNRASATSLLRASGGSLLSGHSSPFYKGWVILSSISQGWWEDR